MFMCPFVIERGMIQRGRVGPVALYHAANGVGLDQARETHGVPEKVEFVQMLSDSMRGDSRNRGANQQRARKLSRHRITIRLRLSVMVSRFCIVLSSGLKLCSLALSGT